MIAARRRAPWLVLSLACIVGCSNQDDLVRELSKPSEFADVAVSRREYPTQWLGSRTLTVADGVHVLGELFPSAAYAIETREGTILIDTGVDQNVSALRESLLAVGLPIESIRRILLTHAHYDHVFGANKLRELSSAVVCAGRQDCEILRTADEDALFSLFPRREYSGAAIEIDQELDDGDVIELGDVAIHVIGSPGHTAGSVCYLLEKNNQRILFSGDVIASLNFGPATYPVHISPRYRGDAQAYLRTIDRLLEMEPPDLLLTGHPRQQTRLQSIVMDRSQWNSLLVPAKKELETVISRHHQDGADFLDGTAKEIDSGLYYLGDLDNTAVYCITRDDELIVINAPGGNGYREFLSSRLGSLGLTSTTPTIVLLTSSEANNYSGLESLDPSPLVVVPRGALESMRGVGVENAVSDREFDDITPFPIQTIDLEGSNRQSLAYHFAVGSKQVLVTPRVPRNITLFWANRHSGRTTSSPLQPQTRNLISELRESPSGCKGYRDSLNQLNKIRPDIWLPAMPLTGQNANLYDNHWETIIETNRELADSLPQAR